MEGSKKEKMPMNKTKTTKTTSKDDVAKAGEKLFGSGEGASEKMAGGLPKSKY